MWDTDAEIEKVVALLEKRLPGSRYDMEDIVDDYRDDLDALDELVKEVSNPWCVIAGTYGLFGCSTQAELVDIIMDEYSPYMYDGELIEIYHDGKKVNWKFTIEIDE